MAVTDLLSPLVKLPLPLVILVLPLVSVLALLYTVQIYTTRRYHHSVQTIVGGSKKGPALIVPPKLPYRLPFLGQAQEWLSGRPGDFFGKVFAFHPRDTGACTLLLGGETIHMLFSPLAVSALLKDRNSGRDGFNMRIEERGLGVDRSDVVKYEGLGSEPDETGLTVKQRQEKMNHHYMMEKTAVDGLTGKFLEVFKLKLEEEYDTLDAKEGKTVGLNRWLISQMFPASTTSLFGSRALEVYPELQTDFFEFDRVILSLFFGLPRFLNRKAFEARDKVSKGMLKWQELMIKESNGKPADPDGEVDWEPIWGSRLNRAKQMYYMSEGISVAGRAAFDLGVLFALNSNSLPAAGWMLMHILDPKGDPTLLPRLLKELEAAEKPDGSFDIPTLVTLPLMQSVLHEVLRLYVDVLFTREITEDLKLPHNDGKQRILFEKGSVIIAPTWLGHRDEGLWTSPPCNEFCADRWLRTDPETGKQSFSTTGTAGKFFPFGGGRTMCPGRNFAKQEILASVATVLTMFDFMPLGFVDAKGEAMDRFPTFRDGLLGSGIMATDEDMKVKITRKMR